MLHRGACWLLMKQGELSHCKLTNNTQHRRKETLVKPLCSMSRREINRVRGVAANRPRIALLDGRWVAGCTAMINRMRRFAPAR